MMDATKERLREAIDNMVRLESIYRKMQWERQAGSEPYRVLPAEEKASLDVAEAAGLVEYLIDAIFMVS